MNQRSDAIVFGVADAERADKPLHYSLCGLDNVYLVSGFKEVVLDGETYTSVTNVDGLHQMIAFRLAVLLRPLSSQEVRFLRKYLAMTQEQLGRVFKVTRKTVNEYENGTEMPRPSQIVLQLKVARRLFEELDQSQLHVLNDWLDSIVNETTGWLLGHEEAGEREVPPAFMVNAAFSNWRIETNEQLPLAVRGGGV